MDGWLQWNGTSKCGSQFQIWLSKFDSCLKKGKEEEREKEDGIRKNEKGRRKE